MTISARRNEGTHAAGAPPLPRHALVADAVRTRVGVVGHALGGPAVVTFEGEDGTLRYVTESEWLSGAAALAKRSVILKSRTGREGETAGQMPTSSNSDDAAPVTRSSKDTAKVTLYRSLFAGRPDVYALGYVDRRKQGDLHGGPLPRLSYAPVCKNRWKRGVCPKAMRTGRGVRCASCERRDLEPLSAEAIKSHLIGRSPEFKDVIAAYPIDIDGNVRFLVADFDGEGWKAEASAYRDAARELAVPVACEISRSGNGAHLWAFFSESVPAHLARDLGSCIITRALADGGITSLSAYDRLFPTQDSVVPGGFGNAVALPLQGRALQVGATVFVDEGFHQYEDQWAFLSHVGRMTAHEVEHVVKAGGGRPLGELAAADAETGEGVGTSIGEPGGATPARCGRGGRRKMPALATENLPQELRVTRSNALLVERTGLSPRAVDRLRRLAAFANPAFYRAQAMHQSVQRIPRVIDCGSLTSSQVCLPRGCEDALVELCKAAGTSIKFEDERTDATPIEVSFKGSLRQHQQEAAEALLANETGVLSAPTGFGKTVVSASIIASLGARTLVVVPSRALLDQWHERLLQFLDLGTRPPVRLTKKGKPSKRQPSPIGIIGGGRDIPTGIVDVATFQSLVERGEDGTRRARDLVEGYDLVICDECHHVAAPSLELVLRSVRAHHVYGMSATPSRADGLQQLVFMQCGPIRYAFSPKAQAAEQAFDRVLVPRFTGLELGEDAPGGFNAILDHVCQSESRNRLIVGDALHVMEEGRTPVILTRRKAHVRALASLLEERGARVAVLMGGGSERGRRDELARVWDMPRDQAFAIVATGSYVGEGFDLPRLDTLLLAAPVSAEQVLTQYTGRIQRERQGRAAAMVFDYVDSAVPMLDGMYRKRLRTYARLGYKPAANRSGEAAGDGFFVGEDVGTGLSRDVSDATRSVRVCASWASPQRTRRAAKELAACVERGLQIDVTIMRPRSDRSLARTQRCVDLLSKVGCKVRLSEGRVIDCVVVDGEVVWYGSLSALGTAKEDDCCLRTTSREVAASLERVG